MESDFERAARRFAVFASQVLEPAVFGPPVPLHAAAFQCDDPLPYAQALRGTYRPVPLGWRWGPVWSTAWFKLTGSLSAELAERPVALRFSCGTEALLWRDGVPWHAFDPYHASAPLFDAARGLRAAAGAPVELYVEAACNRPLGATLFWWDNPELQQTWTSATPGQVLGAMGLAATARFDARSATRLTPVVLADLHRPPGNGYLAMLALTAAGMGLAIYAAPVLQSLAGLTALQAGYVVAVQALVWTGCAFAVGGASERAERLLIPLGAVLIAAAAAGLGPALGTGEAWPAAAAAAVMGAGFGISSSLMNRRVLRSLGAGDLATGSSAFIAVRQVGGAFGASAAGVAANTAGFAVGFSPEIAVETALWTAAPCAVFGLLGIYAALRLSRRRA